MSQIDFAWLEITGKCQLACEHCYAASGPDGTHGRMDSEDWRSVITQLADRGVTTVQFIGGEPTLHPGLPALITHALSHGLRVEVFSNLVHVAEAMWEVLERPGVSLATSYYSDDSAEHAAITRRPSYTRTRANIAEAVRRGIPIRAGVVEVLDGQRADAARRQLIDLGVRSIGTDRLRQVGRGVRNQRPDTSQLCGRCASGVIAISPDGAVWPCVFSRWLPVGNVLETALADVLDSPAAEEIRSGLRLEFERRAIAAEAAKKDPCGPKNPCDPQCGPACGPACQPSCWPTGTGPCRPKGGCQPNYD
ncbi:radical SAM protein [Streptomyces sp. DSM 44917]|uniref:Radical SAM protein n=1 Tax=Streptomyces boetiae TaxID=3075541 RepID=A0ABU2L2T3_9ACTN|nr:radical SAM protein [Streptomyces sp. DSM 44917]MDT0305868.1 radical SAM protein [Streptomyces sp. DSM 44917]